VITNWDDLVRALGEPEGSATFTHLVSEIGEQPLISEDPSEYTDPLGHTKYYKFIKNGLEIGFRQDRFNHVHLYTQSDEGYGQYTGPLMDGIRSNQPESSIVQALGAPSTVGGGSRGLLGYMNRWLRYERDNYEIRLEFTDKQQLRKVSLILL
jgi:hypothetical protein